MRKKNRGFTLGELAIVIAVLAVVVAVVAPQYTKFVGNACEQAALTDCSNCVTVAKTMFQDQQIPDETVALASKPSTDTEEKPDGEVESFYDNVKQQANVDGTIQSIVYSNDQISKLVYITENGKYTITFEHGDYTAEKNN